MPPKSRGTTSHYPLKMMPAERATVESEQAWFGQAGLTVSLNETIRHLIRRAEMGVPSAADGVQRLKDHTAACETCEPYRPPRCMDGIWLREMNRMLSEQDEGR